jgi:hypothetical protein
MEKQLSEFNLGKITREVISLKKAIGQGIISLGEKISIVKENLPSNEWMEWLKRDVKIPYVSAYRYIKIAKELDATTVDRLGASRVYEILELPPSTFREELIALAPNLKVSEVRKLVKEKKKEDELESETPDIIEQATPMLTFADTALELNANFLDALEHITFAQLPENYLDLFESQMRKTAKATMLILEVVRNVKS